MTQLNEKFTVEVSFSEPVSSVIELGQQTVVSHHKLLTKRFDVFIYLIKIEGIKVSDQMTNIFECSEERGDTDGFSS